MNRFLVLLLSFFVVAASANAQDDDSVAAPISVQTPKQVAFVWHEIAPINLEKLSIMEDSMLTTSDSMFNAFLPDTRTGYCERFVRQLIHALKIPNSYYYDFKKIADRINIIYADDSAFKIFNWGIQPTISTERYYGAIQLTIDEHGIKFGAPIFGYPSENFPGKPVNRFVLEYKKGVQVGMNWDAERNAIVFDYLVSQINDPHRKYTFVPSGQYDGFRWGSGVWNYVRDLIPITILQDGQAPDGSDK